LSQIGQTRKGDHFPIQNRVCFFFFLGKIFDITYILSLRSKENLLSNRLPGTGLPILVPVQQLGQRVAEPLSPTVFTLLSNVPMSTNLQKKKKRIKIAQLASQCEQSQIFFSLSHFLYIYHDFPSFPSRPHSHTKPLILLDLLLEIRREDVKSVEGWKNVAEFRRRREWKRGCCFSDGFGQQKNG
jgi:hypothetical protein